jgi:hypothetical protein
MRFAAITICFSLFLMTGCSHDGVQTSAVSVLRPTPVSDDYPPHAALMGFGYRLKSLVACTQGKAAMNAWDRRYLGRIEAVEAALRERVGKDVKQRDLIIAGGCHDPLSERELRRNFERELKAWEIELSLRQ